MKYHHTAVAAKTEKRSTWDLIAAIAVDAHENGLPVTGVESRVAAKDALAGEGLDYADNSIRMMATLSEFDFASTGAQRKIWRRYGWTTVMVLAGSGWSQEAAAKYLDVPKLRKLREAQAAAARGVISPTNKPSRICEYTPSQLDRAWSDWASKLTTLMIRGAELAEATEPHPDYEWGAQAAIAQMVYGRIVERQLDAEIRDLLESEMNA